jgi:hypothetical protein
MPDLLSTSAFGPAVNGVGGKGADPVYSSQSTSAVRANAGNRDDAAPNFFYPEGLTKPPFDKWVYFEARSGRHVVRDQVINELNGVDRTLASVGLYLSETALQNTLAVVYETPDLGPFAGAIVEMLAQSGRNLMDVMMSVGNDWVGNLKKGLMAIGTGDYSGASLAVGQAATALGSNLGGALGTAAGLADTSMGSAITTLTIQGFNGLSAGSGTAAFGKRPNPKTDVLFATQSYRHYEMTFLMVPRNIREAQTIDNIVRFFQFYMLPKYDAIDPAAKVSAFMLGFPYEFEITLRDPNGEMAHVNKFERSVLENVKIDHAAGQKTAFVKDNGVFWPVATQITLAFKEVRLLDRNSPAILRADGNGLAGGSLAAGASGPTRPLFPDPRT